MYRRAGCGCRCDRSATQQQPRLALAPTHGWPSLGRQQESTNATPAMLEVLQIIVFALALAYVSVTFLYKNVIAQMFLPPKADPLGRKVEVSRKVLNSYGAMEWLVRFTANPGHTPPGAGDVDTLVVTSTLLTPSPTPTVEPVVETQKGARERNACGRRQHAPAPRRRSR